MKRLLPLAALALFAGFAAYGCSDSDGPTGVTDVPTFTPQFHTAIAPYTTPLIAGQDTDIGEVQVWNDADYLYVKLVSTGDCLLETHVAVEESWEDIPQTKKGNPIPGQFEYSDPHACVQEYTYEIPLTWDYGTPLYIAAHAATGVSETMTFVSELGKTVYGPITGDNEPTDWGTPDAAVRAYNWLGYTRDLSDPDQIPGCTTNPLSSLTWSWGFGMNPSYSPDIPEVIWISTAPNTEQWDVDSWRKFVEDFEVPGEPISGSLEVNADNYYVVSNGETVGSDDDIFNGPETYTFIPMLGSNTLEFVTENRAQGSADNYCDQLRNPNGLTYKGTIEYYADGETAWGYGEEFPGNNWGMYVTYTVQCPYEPGLENGGFEAPVVNTTQGWDIFTSSEVEWTVEWAGTYAGAPTDAYLELHRGVNNWTPYDGDQHAELDTDWQGPGSAGGEQASVRISQDLETCAGWEYKVSFAYSPRPEHADNVLQVYWDGELVDTYSVNGSANSNTVWTPVTLTLTASGLTTELAFVEGGTPDSFGMFLDAVSVTRCDGSCP